jgi:N-acetylglutamate synthase-like GNAT family acetyltransferase
MEIKSEVRGSQSGQIDQTLYAEQEGKVVAYLNFSEYEGEVAVQMIKVAEAFRRKGIGAMLLKALQRQYPDTEIDLGGLTDDGAHLIKSLTFKTVTDPHLDKLFRLQQRVKDHLTALNELPDDQKMHHGDRWSRLNDMETRLENELLWKSPTKQIIC